MPLLPTRNAKFLGKKPVPPSATWRLGNCVIAAQAYNERGGNRYFKVETDVITYGTAAALGIIISLRVQLLLAHVVQSLGQLLRSQRLSPLSSAASLRRPGEA